jgi:hypothetical protein
MHVLIYQYSGELNSLDADYDNDYVGMVMKTPLKHSSE